MPTDQKLDALTDQDLRYTLAVELFKHKEEDLKWFASSLTFGEDHELIFPFAASLGMSMIVVEEMHKLGWSFECGDREVYRTTYRDSYVAFSKGNRQYSWSDASDHVTGLLVCRSALNALRKESANES